MSCAEQFRVMAFAQLTYRESLRDIEVSLSAQAPKLYHMGFREPIRRSTLADANESRDWRIYADFAQPSDCPGQKALRQRRLGAGTVEHASMRSTRRPSICVCRCFPWALFRTTKSAVKMHTLLDLRGNIPSFIHISDGKLHDVHALDLLIAGSRCDLRHGSGLCRLRAPACACIWPGLSSSPAPSRTSKPIGFIRLRQTATPASSATKRSLSMVSTPGRITPTHLRRVRFNDPETGKSLVFLTNQTILPAATICALYKSRWQVELFFKWIKQHLRIKQFFGTSENAVKTQIWIAVSVYVLVASSTLSD